MDMDLSKMSHEEKDAMIRGLIIVLDKVPAPAGDKVSEDTLKWCNQNFAFWRDNVLNPALHNLGKVWLDTVTESCRLDLKKTIYEELKKFEDVDLNDGDDIKIIINRHSKIEELDGSWLAICADEILCDWPAPQWP